jgi:hypothetical protein
MTLYQLPPLEPTGTYLEERRVADRRMCGIKDTPTQCDGKHLPCKLDHTWWFGADTNVVKSCGKQTCRVCSPDHGPYEYGVIQSN